MGTIDLHNFNFVSAKANKISPSSMKQSLTGTNPVGLFRQAVIQYDDVMLNWLNESDSNKQQFLQDPIGCFKKIAKPDDETLKLLASASAASPAEARQTNQAAEKAAAVKASKASSNSDSAGVSTHGWDLMAAIKIGKLNKLLSIVYNKGYLPTDFDYSASLTIAGAEISIKATGKVGTPSVTGGTGELIDVTFPITSGTVTAGETEYDLGSDTKLTASIQLERVETTRSDKTTVYTYNLILEEKAISNVTVSGAPEDLVKAMGGSDILAAILKTILTNPDKSIKVKICDISAPDIPDEYTFLVPSKSQYSFKQFSDLESSALAMLILTTSEKEGSRTVDDDIIPDDCDASLVIENKLFLENVLKDPIVEALETDDGNLEIKKITDGSESYYQIYNTQSFTTKEVEGYTPEITDFTASEHDGYLYIHMDAVITPTDGINLKYYADGKYSAEITTENGTQKFSLKEESFDSDHSLDIEWWVWLIAAAASIATFFVGGVVVVAICAALSFSAIGIIGGIISACAPDGLSSSVFSNALNTVKWAHTGEITFQEIDFYGDVLIGVTSPMLED